MNISSHLSHLLQTRMGHLESRFLQIKSDDPEVQQKGRLLQLLIILLTIPAVAQGLYLIVSAPNLAGNATTPATGIQQAIGSLFLGLFCLAFVRRGHSRLAAHLFFASLNVIFLVLLINTARNTFFPYLMLIAIVAIAALDSARMSILYTLVTVTAVSLYFYLAPSFSTAEIVAYLATSLSVSLTAWITAASLQNAVQTSDQLAQDLHTQSHALQKRATQLQLSAEIAQVSTASLDLSKMLRQTAELIRNQFNFYHVSIFLFDDTRQQLLLTEEVGEKKVNATPEAPYRIAIGSESIITWVATNQKARIANNVANDPLYLAEPLLPETRSEAALPLTARGQVLGVLDVQSRDQNAFQTEDIVTLQIITNQMAVNIDNAQLFAETQSRLNDTQTLFNFNTLLATTMDVGEVYRRAARAYTTHLQASQCTLFSWEPDAQTVTAQVDYIHEAADGTVDQFNLELRVLDLTKHQGISEALRTQEPHIHHLANKELEPVERDLLQELGANCYLEVPLVQGAEPTGVVRLYRQQTLPIFSPADVQLAQAMANQTAVALANARLASEAQGRVAHLSTLNRMSQVLAQAPAIKEIFDGARREILSFIEATGMSILLVTPEGDKLHWLYGYEFGQEVDLSNLTPKLITEARGYSAHVARTREVLYVHKDDHDLRSKFQPRVIGANVGTWLGLPMIVANELVGVLAVENDDEFSEREIELLRTVVGPLASAIKNLLQLEEIQAALATQLKQRVQLQTAAEVAAAATSVLNPGQLMQEAVDLIKERFELYYVGLFLTDPESGYAVLRAGTGEAGQKQIAEKRQLPIGGKSLIGGATGDGIPRIIQDVYQDEEWLLNPHLPNTRSELALPLRVRGQVIGALTVQSDEPHLFGDELVSTLQTMSDQLAIAIDNARLLARTEARAQRQMHLNEISARLHQSADVNQIIGIGLQALSEHLKGASIELQLGQSAPQQDNKQS